MIFRHMGSLVSSASDHERKMTSIALLSAPGRTAALVLSASLTLILAACGGSGGDASPVSAESNAAVAAQIDEIRPADETESVGVFVELDGNAPVAAAALNDSDARRVWLQQRFLADLGAAAAGPVAGAATTGCSSADLQTRLSNAKRPAAGNTVRIELNSCELDLLPRMPMVRGVHVDRLLTTQAASDATALQQAVVQSFDGQTAWPTLAGQSLAGGGRVIAVLDTGVEERHPALGSTKVLPGACFSTAANGGTGFCPNGTSVDTVSSTAGRSCVDRFSSRAAGLNAGCGHGTSMAAVAAMDYGSVAANRGGLARAASILPIQVFNADSRGAISASSGDLLAAIEWVTEQARQRRASGQPPIAALNMSLGAGAYSAACDSDYLGGLFRSAFERLRAQGVIPVVAAGNGGTIGAISFPACVSNALPVAAARLDYSRLASYSNFSSQVKLVAIGGDAVGTYKTPVPCSSTSSTDCWAATMGTSPATAMVSGAVAALHGLQATPDAAALQSALTANLTANDTRAKALTVSGLTVPALRVTPSAERLAGVAATVPDGSSGNAGSGSGAGTSNGSGTSGSGTSGGGTSGGGATPPGGSDGVEVIVKRSTRVCVYWGAQYSGLSSCAIARLDADDSPILYSYLGPVRSVSIRDADTNQPVAGRVRVTLYASFRTRSDVSVTQDTPNISGGPFNAFVRSIQVSPLQ
jgi:uncharacterized membrane protein YgcG